MVVDLLLLTVVLAVDMFGLMADQSIDRVYLDEVECILGVLLAEFLCMVQYQLEENVASGDAWTWEQVNVGEQAQMKDFQFNENEGLKVRIKDNPQQIDFVELYFTEILLQLIVTEAIRYAEQYIEVNPEKADTSYVGKWNPVTSSGMRLFLGLLLLTGITRKGNF